MTAADQQQRGTADRFRLTPDGHVSAAADLSPAAGRTDLDVPYAEKDDAKRLGARWDAGARTWYVPPGMNPAPFARWSSPASTPGAVGSTVRARVLALAQVCYRCRRPTSSVVGVLVTPDLTDAPDGFIPFDDIAEALAVQLDGARLADLGVGELRQRWSGVVKRAYMSNGCHSCGALQGSFPLREALIAHRATGGGYEELVITDVDLSVDLLEDRAEDA